MPVSLEFIVGGGAHLTFDYRIRGGPFDGDRISLAPVRSVQSLAYGRSIATDPEEWDRTLGPEVRPTIERIIGEVHLLHGTAAWAALDPETEAIVRATLSTLGS